MGHSQTEKAESRERILAAAAQQIREGGLEAIGIARLMQAAGLTHGGFYNHFASKQELMSEALARALADSGSRSRAVAAGAPSGRALETTVRSYLSRAHRDAAAEGCAIAGLLTEVARAEPEVREAMSANIDAFIARMSAALRDEGEGILAVCAMVGALGLSRVATDPKRSDAILETVRDFVLTLARER